MISKQIQNEPGWMKLWWGISCVLSIAVLIRYLALGSLAAADYLILAIACIWSVLYPVAKRRFVAPRLQAPERVER